MNGKLNFQGKVFMVGVECIVAIVIAEILLDWQYSLQLFQPSYKSNFAHY